MKSKLLRFGVFAILLLSPFPVLAAPGDLVFVTQVPVPSDFANIGATFGNQGGSVDEAPRGGDLWVRYSDGTLKNITQTAGYGVAGQQGSTSIAVRDPAVHWSGSKVVFSMVIGSPAAQYQVLTFHWQLYEVTGLGRNETPVITKVPNQPTTFNNVMPTYGTDERIIFASDRPRNGADHLYPQRDEYESTHTNSGLWSLDPANGDLKLLDHAPSGAFHPFVDSYGRVIYTRWDHMQRDQQAGGLTDYGAFNFSDESASAQKISSQSEFYPEPRNEFERTTPTLNLHTFNQFFPWQVNEDGSEHETVNHVGRHEFQGYFDRSFNDDPNLTEYYGQISRFNPNPAQNFFELREDPLHQGNYYAVDGPEFGTHAAGQIIRFNGQLGLPADQMAVTYITHRETASTDDTPSVNHSGLYRNPLPLTTGTLLAVHTSETRQDSNVGTSGQPVSRYQFRIKQMQGSSPMTAGAALTSGISKTLTYWNPDTFITFSGNLWELQPVELVARNRPSARTGIIDTPEAGIFAQEGVDTATFQNYLRQRKLAVIVMRNITSRDSADVEQPFNLRVANTNTQKIPRSGKIYDVAHLQLFQGDLIRGYGGVNDPQAGRRVLAQPMHDAQSLNPANPSGPTGSVHVASDGSVAAFVPAERALTWQLTDPAGAGVVRERYWLTFKPGEVRVCASCHGLNSHDQVGGGVPQNQPEALRLLLQNWKALGPDPDPDPNPNPNPQPPPPPPPSGPVFSVQTQTELSRRQIVPDMLVNGKKTTFTFTSSDATNANASGLARFAVEGVECPNVAFAFSSNASGTATQRIKAPSTKKSVGVHLSLWVNGRFAGAQDLPFLSGKRKESAKPLKSKDLMKICSGLKPTR